MKDLGDIIEGASGPTDVEVDQHTFFWGKKAFETEKTILAHMCAINNDFCDQVRAIVKSGREEYELDEIDCRNCKTSEGYSVVRFGMKVK